MNLLHDIGYYFNITIGSLIAFAAIIFLPVLLISWMFDKAIRKWRGYSAFIDFVWHRKEFKKWMNNCSTERSDKNGSKGISNNPG